MLLLNLHVNILWFVIFILLLFLCLWMVSKCIFKISIKVICTDFKVVLIILIILDILVFLFLIYRACLLCVEIAIVLFLLLFGLFLLLCLWLLLSDIIFDHGFFSIVRVLLDSLSTIFL